MQQNRIKTFLLIKIGEGQKSAQNKIDADQKNELPLLFVFCVKKFTDDMFIVLRRKEIRDIWNMIASLRFTFICQSLSQAVISAQSQ